MESTGIGTRLKELRTEKEISLDLLTWDMNLKYGINLSKGHVSKWENGQNEPSLYYAKLFADYYNVSLDYLIGLTDDRTPSRLLAYYKGVKRISGKKHETAQMLRAAKSKKKELI